MEAIALLEEWVQSVGSQAGLTSQNATILSGAVGVPESRLELEIELDSLAQLEAFWGQLPPREHKAWSERAQHFLIDGSPKWEVYREVAITAASQPSASMVLPATKPAQAQAPIQSGLIMPTHAQSQEFGTSEADVAASEAEEASEDSTCKENIMLDWKGDPMVVNPGDKLPFNFR